MTGLLLMLLGLQRHLLGTVAVHVLGGEVGRCRVR
jgi:hypothetical protein